MVKAMLFKLSIRTLCSVFPCLYIAVHFQWVSALSCNALEYLMKANFEGYILIYFKRSVLVYKHPLDLEGTKNMYLGGIYFQKNAWLIVLA